MHYAYTAIPEAETPIAVEPVFQHVIATFVSEVKKTVSVWKAVPDHYLDFKPHDKTNSICAFFQHQVLSERRFFSQFVRTQEPAVENLLPSGQKPEVAAHIEKYVWLAGSDCRSSPAQLRGG